MILLMNSKFEIMKCHWVVKVKNLQFKNYLSLAAEHHRPDGWQSYVGAQCSKAHGTLCCYEVKLLAFILPWSLREVRYLTFIINVTCGKKPNSPLMTTETRGKKEDGTFCHGLPECERGPQLKFTSQILSFHSFNKIHNCMLLHFLSWGSGRTVVGRLGKNLSVVSTKRI